MEMIEQEHRCKKCKTPLSFRYNYMRTDDEIDERVKKITKNMGFWKSLWFNISEERFSYLIDKNRQYWSCPKCYEEYLVDLRGDKNG